MFAIVSGLGHGAVSRLRLSWEKLPSKYQRLFSDLQDLMDPSRNMSKYRQLVSSEQSQPPIVRCILIKNSSGQKQKKNNPNDLFQIPFYPVVKKDLTFIHLGNDSRVEGLVNFEKLRMIAKEVRTLTNMCSSPYDLLTMLELGNNNDKFRNINIYSKISIVKDISNFRSIDTLIPPSLNFRQCFTIFFLKHLFPKINMHNFLVLQHLN